MTIEFPSTQVVPLQQLGAQLHESRKSGGDLEALARQLLLGFFDLCTRAGLDRVLDDLATARGLDDGTSRAALAEHAPTASALAAQLGTINLDGGGPRNQKPRQLAACVMTALELAPTEEPDQQIPLPDVLRLEVVAAMASVADVELAAPKLRETIIREARARLDEQYHGSFDKIAEQLDEHGLRLQRQPKVPITAMQEVQQALIETRGAVVARVAQAAIDRAVPVIAAANADAAARIDQPVTLRATPREVAVLRAQDPRANKTAPEVVRALCESLGELARITWEPAVRPVQPYAASKTFAIGDVIEHPKFGRGAVVSMLAQRIDVEFPDGIHTLAHVAVRR